MRFSGNLPITAIYRKTQTENPCKQISIALRKNDSRTNLICQTKRYDSLSSAFGNCPFPRFNGMRKP